MEPNKSDVIMAQFDGLSHADQVGLFMEVRDRLLTMRDQRIKMYSDDREIAEINLNEIHEGNKLIVNPFDNSKKAC